MGLHRNTLILLCLVVFISVTLAQDYKVESQYVTVTRSRRAYVNRWTCGWRGWRWWRGWCCYWKCVWETQYFKVRICADGYRSLPNCNVPICRPRCTNNGLCIAKDTCDCPEGTSGSTCNLKVCGPDTDCFPGSCDTATCRCASGFEGPNCQTMKEGPAFGKCQVSLLNVTSVANSYKTLISAQCAPGEEDQTVIWSKERDFDKIGIVVDETYRDFEDRPAYPKDGYLRDFRVGLIKAELDIILKDKNGGIIGSSQKIGCSGSANSSHPETSINCDEKPDFLRGFSHNQTLEVVMSGTTGGMKEIRYNNAPFESKPFTGQIDRRSVSFRFDLQPPYHCSEYGTCCAAEGSCEGNVNADSYVPMTTLEDITHNPKVVLMFLGWDDFDSGMTKYHYNVYRMSLNGDVSAKLQEHDTPVLSGTLSLLAEEDDVKFTLPSPGLYSVIGSVEDLAGNNRYARTFVMYADTSKIVEKYNASMTVSGSTNRVQRTHWLTGTSPSPVTVSWSGLFGNPYLEKNNFLAPIRDRPETDLIDASPRLNNISRSGTPNKRGITKFQYAIVENIQIPSARKRRQLPAPTNWLDVDNPDDDQVQVLPPTGAGMTVIVKATDMFGNTETDFSYIRRDNDPPNVLEDSLEFVTNVIGPRNGYYSSVDIVVGDQQSGVFRIDSEVFDTGGTPNVKIGNASQPGQRAKVTASCAVSADCYCTEAVSTECYERIQRVFINNCLFVEYMGVEARFNAIIYNAALLNTPISLNLGVISGLSGIDEYPPPFGFRVQRTFGIGAFLTWHNPGACYRFNAIFVTLEGKGKVTQPHSNAIECELSEMSPNTVYMVSIYIEYDNRKRSEMVLLEFNSGDGPPQKGLGAGAIVGIIIGVLLLIAIIIIVIMIVVRLIRHQPPVPQRIYEMRSNISDRLTKRFSHVDIPSGTTMHVAYKLQGTDQDIYAYGEMETDADAKWKHSTDHIKIGRTIHKGRFAEIKEGNLTNDVGTRKVAVKMLMEHTEDNILLMKAKMNFLATAAPHHNNIVNFVGAITEGPVILLEYCDLSLKDWLKANQKVTDEVEDNMVNFCTDIARGMKHLHDNEIIHRRLGTRNVLLKDVSMMGRLVAKVTGFGPMKGEQARTDAGPERIPIKWMAPEQLGLGKKAKRPYNDATDVWSYGITVWEIYSLGNIPFSDVKHSEMKGLLERGVRPERPGECSDELYTEVMMKCWEEKPAMRPLFSEITDSLERMFHGAVDGDEYFDDEYGTGQMYDATGVSMEELPPNYNTVIYSDAKRNRAAAQSSSNSRR